MSASAMLSLSIKLNIQPGEIPPTIHLKKGSNSMKISLKIAADDATLETGGTAVVKAASGVFLVLPIAWMDEEFITVELESEQVERITNVAGTFEGTVSIIDSENAISEADYEDYDLITVQPFILEVQASATT